MEGEDGPHILRNTLYALIEYGEAALPDILRMLSNKAIQRQVLAKVTNSQVKSPPPSIRFNADVSDELAIQGHFVIDEFSKGLWRASHDFKCLLLEFFSHLRGIEGGDEFDVETLDNYGGRL